MVKAGRHDPNNRAWAENKNRFGMKMLQKMGWKEGMGLGANEDGSTEHVKVKTREDNVGVGNSMSASSWRGNTERFEVTLERLKNLAKQNHNDEGDSDDSDAKPTPGVYIPSSPKLKAAPLVASRRVYNRKLVRAKQEFKNDEEGRAKIVGKHNVDLVALNKKDKKEKKEKKRQEKDNLTEMQVTASVTMTDYFANMATKSGETVMQQSQHITFASWNSGKADAPAHLEQQEQERKLKKKKRVRSISRSPATTSKKPKKREEKVEEEEFEPRVVVVHSPKGLSPRTTPRASPRLTPRRVKKDKKEKKEKKSKKEKKEKK